MLYVNKKIVVFTIAAVVFCGVTIHIYGKEIYARNYQPFTPYMEEVYECRSNSEIEVINLVNKHVQNNIIIYNGDYYPKAKTLTLTTDKPKNIKHESVYLIGNDDKIIADGWVRHGKFGTMSIVFEDIKDIDSLKFIDIVEATDMTYDPSMGEINGIRICINSEEYKY